MDTLGQFSAIFLRETTLGTPCLFFLDLQYLQKILYVGHKILPKEIYSRENEFPPFVVDSLLEE